MMTDLLCFDDFDDGSNFVYVTRVEFFFRLVKWD